ncbi:EAL domain-containing protein [Haploplasma axanthum]|uniref:Bacteriophytochrome cph2 n=1 Tax=Haploplasma axanthum TaxID=29552 RepID=A0A449BE86_HAPAX|nr:EAL domain-containing protein [Haploplasma axanthum]VEU80620.1 Bacteriophytochrome cph2 [Haploplasma axanthum]
MKKFNQNIIQNIYVLLLITVLTLFFFIFIRKSINEDARIMAQNNNNGVATLLNKTFETDYELFVNNGFKNENIFDLTEQNLIIDVDTLKQWQITSLDKIISNSDDSLKKVVFYKENQLGVKLINEYEYLFNDNSNIDYLIIDQQGIIKYSTNNKYQGKIQNNIKPVRWLDDNLSRNSYSSIKSNDMFISYMKIDNGFILFQLANSRVFINQNQNLVYAIIIFMFLMIFIVVTYYLILKKNFNERVKKLDQLVFSKYDYFYIAVLNLKGKIIRTNTMFKDEFLKDKKFETIFELDKFNIKDSNDLKDNSKIYFRLNNKRFSFKIFRKENTYSVVGEVYNEQLEKYQKLAYSNSISGVGNLFAFTEYVNNTKNDKESTYVIVDIKDFNKIMQFKGYSASVKIIKKITDIFDQNKKEGIKLFHVKIDTFILVIDGHIDERWVTRRIKKYESISLNENETVMLEYKTGIVHSTYVVGSDGEKIYDTLLITLTRAKKSSIYDIITYDDNLKLFLTNREIMLKDLNNALVNDEFIIFLQPKLDLRDKRIKSFEALLRWNNPKYLKRSPEEYITLAEESDLIVKIGDIVIEKTFEILKDYKNKNINIAINISPKQIIEQGFVNKLILAARKNEIEPSQISIEVTETILVETFDIVIEKIKSLKKAGFSIHLDDFGTGYSSLKYLKDLPIDVIKIDKQFIKDMSDDLKSEAIVKTMIQLTHELGLTVVAEGIENKQELEKLKILGCDYIQGYLISKPVIAKEALLKYNKTIKF